MEQTPKKILIVDDDPLTVKIIQSHLLAGARHTILVAVDVEEGLTKARAEKPDLVLLDILLPGRSGFDFLQAIKADDTTKSIPVIVLSNMGQEEAADKALELGAADYVIKGGVSLGELLQKAEKILGVSPA